MSEVPGEPSLARHRCLVLSPRLFEALAESNLFCRRCGEQLAGSSSTWRPARKARRTTDLVLHFSEDGTTALCGTGLSTNAFYVAVME